jgi:D-aminopeptidase
VTAIVPFGVGELFRSRVPAGAAVLNGAGEAIGLTTIAEWGTLESPIFLTSSMAIGRVYDAAVEALVALDETAGIDDAIMPVVAECDDGWLNGSRIVQVDHVDTRAALDAVAGAEAGPTPGGAIGAGTGMVCFDLKGGIGTASRVVAPIDRRRSQADAGSPAAGAEPTYTVGVLVLANFGRLERLTVDGVPVGRSLVDDERPGGTIGAGHERGSCIVVVATDAPLLGHALERLARRAGLGLARTGSSAGHGSGDIFIAFSTGVRIPRGSGEPTWSVTQVDDEHLDPFFSATVDATEAAVLDAMFQADTVVGRDGHVVEGLPIERTLGLLRAAGRLGP